MFHLLISSQVKRGWKYISYTNQTFRKVENILFSLMITADLCLLINPGREADTEKCIWAAELKQAGGKQWESWENGGRQRHYHHYYVIACRPSPPVACDGRLTTPEPTAPSCEESACWRNGHLHLHQIRSLTMCTVGVEESFPPPRCCVENRNIILLLVSATRHAGHCRSLLF